MKQPRYTVSVHAPIGSENKPLEPRVGGNWRLEATHMANGYLVCVWERVLDMREEGEE